MTKNPNKWIRRRRNARKDREKTEELSEEQIDALENFVINYRNKPRSAYDKLGCLKKIMLNCVPEAQNLYEPTDSLINELSYRIAEETNTPDTEKAWKRDLKAFLQDYKKGEYADKRDTISVTPNQGRTRKVEPWMIYPVKTWKKIADSATYPITSAFVATLYNTAATPGELLQANLEDVRFKEGEIKIRGNKNHRDGTFKIRPFARNYLKDYLRTHPAVDNLADLNYKEPLWIRYHRNHCKKCGLLPRKCGKISGCSEFEPEEVERLEYSGFYKQLQNAVERADIELKHQEEGIKPKYARKSAITEAVRNGIDQRLENFARWRPESGQKESYVSLADEDIVEWMEDTYGKGTEEEKKDEEQLCGVCGVWNQPGAETCRNCERFLSTANKEKSKLENEKDEKTKLKEISDKQAFIQELKEELKSDLKEDGIAS